MTTAPTFEPEIYYAKTKKWRGDPDKMPTTGVSKMMIGGVVILSRYRHAKEFDILAEIIGDMEPGMQRLIGSVFCDSKASWVIDAELFKWDKDVAKDVAEWLALGLQELVGGFNGIRVFSGQNSAEMDANWEGGNI